MHLVQKFAQFLFSQSLPASPITVKNYKADILHFIRWYEDYFKAVFDPKDTTSHTIFSYKKSVLSWMHEKEKKHQPYKLSASSLNRHLSSLRKFFSFLTEEGIISTNPLSENTKFEARTKKDPWKLEHFKSYLFISRISPLTIKNYIMDIRQFMQWAEEVTNAQEAWEIASKSIFPLITKELLQTYKERLLLTQALSPASINRKLSSLRKYVGWLNQEGIISIPQENEDKTSFSIFKSDILRDTKEQYDAKILEEELDVFTEEKKYSSFPPVRLFQKTSHGFFSIFDKILTEPLAKFLENRDYQTWKKNHDSLFIEKAKHPATTVRNIKKELYAPFSIVLKHASFGQKIWFHLLHTRPRWYKTYHKLPLVHYIHFALLMAFTTLVVFAINNKFSASHIDPVNQKAVLAASTSPLRLLTYQGNLTDNNNYPITKEKTMRFAIYNDAFSYGKSLLWEEAISVTPNQEGNFSVLLGQTTPLPQRFFTDNNQLYLGTRVEDTEELKPRQPLANVTYASSADLLQGLPPITQTGAGTTNVVLALDSAGNLTIGGNGNPVFQALGGTLSLSGHGLLLATNKGSDASIQIAPDGNGFIDIQKPLRNTTNNNNLSSALGSVEVNDTFAILATSSAQSALQISQNGIGKIISASQGEIAKFSLENDGSGYFAGNLAIGTSSARERLAVSGDIYAINGQVRIGNFDGGPIPIGPGSIYFDTKKSYFYYSDGGKWKELGRDNIWQTASGSAMLQDTTADLLIGGQTSSSAKFAFTNIGQNIPTAVFAGNLIFSNNPLIATTGNLPLTIGNAQTGNILIGLTSNIGIGTVTPLTKLDVIDSQTSTISARISNSSNSFDADVLALKVATTTATPTNYFLTFLNGRGEIIGKIHGNGSTGVSYATTGNDFAEYYKKEDINEPFLAGDLVCIGKKGGVIRCREPAASPLGIISDRPGFIGGSHHQYDPMYVLVGIIGQLPVNISEENGQIQPGDVLGISRIPGKAAKLVAKGYSIGQALEAGISPLTAIRVSWHDPSVFITGQGNLSNAKSEAFPKNPKTLAQTTTDIGQKIIEEITAGVLKAKEVSSDTITIAGINLKDYIIQVVENNRADEKNHGIISPVVTIESLQTNLISPLASSSGSIVIQLGQTKNASGAAALVIQNASGSAVAVIDSNGSATFSGTLRAKKLIADEIDFSENALAKIQQASSAARYITNITNNYQTASNSADFALATLESDFGTFSQGLIALGPTSLNDVSASNVYINKQLALKQNSIISLTDTLEIQPLKTANISFLSGRVVIDTDGNIQVDGNAVFAKDVTVKNRLSANILSPLANQDLIIDLQNETASQSSKLVIQNASGSAVISFDTAGNFYASGSARLSKVITNLLTIAREAQADTSTKETIASASAGNATILANEIERTIITPHITDKSLIYVSPASDTLGQTPYVARQTAQTQKERGSFTIHIAKPVTKDIKLNWWIIN